MSSTATLSPETAGSIKALIVQNHRKSLDRAIATLAATPDEKLDFKASDTSKSIREIALHIAEGNGYVGQALGIEPQELPDHASKQELENLIKRSTEAIIAKIEALSDAEIAGAVVFFGHTMPMQAFLMTSDWHIARHASQIDYVQTIYGDLEDHG